MEGKNKDIKIDEMAKEIGELNERLDMVSDELQEAKRVQEEDEVEEGDYEVVKGEVAIEELKEELRLKNEQLEEMEKEMQKVSAVLRSLSDGMAR